MPADSNRSKFLFEKYLQNNISAKELTEFWELMEGLQEDDPVTEEIRDVWQQKNHTRHRGDEVKWDDLYDTILRRADAIEKKMKTRRIPGRLIRWQWWAAASAVIFIIAGVWFYHNWEKADVGYNVAEASGKLRAPETNRAMITLADGSTVFLDSITNGEVAQQGNIQVMKLTNGQIAYQTASGEIMKEIQYNTLTNPRGSKVIDIVLSDGTHVWLNAESSISYPVAFVGNDRKVELKGEGYFEVAPNKSKLFQVSAGEMEIKVLGTHFNVNAYEDEGTVKATLLEGLVNVSNNQSEDVLLPGQQALLKYGKMNSIEIRNVDVEQAISWKNGYFNFEAKKLDEVLKEIARWYNVEIVYEGGVPNFEFGGKIERELDLKEVLDILKVSKVKIRIENRKLIVEKMIGV